MYLQKKPSKVVRKVFEKKILLVHFVNHDSHDYLEEENFKNLDSLLDSEIDPFIHLSIRQ